MENKIELLDCTLRDGAYIVDAKFGTPAMKGIIKKMQDANVDIIECGWLKEEPHKKETTFYHVPNDLKQYMPEKNKYSLYAAMIDWDKYNPNLLPECDGQTIDAIRIVFPYGKHKEGIAIGEIIRKKGYKIFYQAANTLAYSDEDLIHLAAEMNKVHPIGLSVVDTFGAMYANDLEHIALLLDQYLDPDIKLGFHSHNNQQLSFALTMNFVELFHTKNRSIIADASLCGMGRGAGNTPTELLANYLNSKHFCNYDMNMIMDAIDTYMEYFQSNYSWGYSTPYFIAGMYCCHVNNIAYLQKNHRTNAKDMRNIIESLSPEERKKYDYALLEDKYLENQNRNVNDETGFNELKNILDSRQILLIAPGKSTELEYEKIQKFITLNHPVIIGVNAINPSYSFDYLFITNSIRYNYAKEVYENLFGNTKKILLSNIKTEGEEDEIILNFNHVVKRGWEYFDNAVITCLRLMDKLNVKDVTIAGFDGFKEKYNESYADAALPTLNPNNRWLKLNNEIQNMLDDFKLTVKESMNINFLTESIFDQSTVK